MKKVSRTIAKNLIYKTDGAFFSVDFIKKDGSIRTMTCRTGVKKHLKGGELAFNPNEYGLAVVYEMNVEGYRMINLNTIMRLKIAGEEYSVI